MSKRLNLKYHLLWAFILCALFSGSQLSYGAVTADTTQTKVILLGTGSPVPDPDRSGPALAILVNGNSYLIDTGTGVVRQAIQAFDEKNIQSLSIDNLKILFLTHLHSDHTLGYPDLILTPWAHREKPLQVYGPEGTEAMTENLLKAYAEDIRVRIEGLEKLNPATLKPNVHEIKPGIIYKDANVTVTAFPVKHGSFPRSFGFKFQTKDRTIVISGDTAPDEIIAEEAKDADILVHEVYAIAKYNEEPKQTQEYLKAFHTSTVELTDIANKAKPKLLVPIHLLGDKDLPQGIIEKEIRNAGYQGKIADSKDLNIY